MQYPNHIFKKFLHLQNLLQRGCSNLNYYKPQTESHQQQSQLINQLESTKSSYHDRGY